MIELTKALVMLDEQLACGSRVGSWAWPQKHSALKAMGCAFPHEPYPILSRLHRRVRQCKVNQNMALQWIEVVGLLKGV